LTIRNRLAKSPKAKAVKSRGFRELEEQQQGFDAE